MGGLSDEDFLLRWDCNRTYRPNEATKVEKGKIEINHVWDDMPYEVRCAYEGCECDLMYSFIWSDVRKVYPKYSEVPEHGIEYDVDWGKVDDIKYTR